ncbi:hypothetical protein KEM55_000246, partial [Ascosphaera atra]
AKTRPGQGQHIISRHIYSKKRDELPRVTLKMGKSKKPRVPFYNHADGPAHKKKKPNEPRTAKKDQNQNKKPQTQNQGPKQSGKPQANQLPTVPFHPNLGMLRPDCSWTLDC